MLKRIFALTILIGLGFFFTRCGGGKPPSVEGQADIKQQQQEAEVFAEQAMDAQEKADSLQEVINEERKTNIVTELDGAKLKKTVNYPYISVKFYQQDTDVEMVLDPLSTNIDLDLHRRPDAELEVKKGDQMLTQMRGDTLHTPAQTQPTAQPFDPTEDLTDDIIRDIQMAQQLFYENKFDEALNILNASLAKKKTASAYALGGSIYFVNGEMTEAVRAWENALKINPNLDELKGLVARYRTAE